MKMNVPNERVETTTGWNIVTKKNGPKISPVIKNTQVHDTLNHANGKIVDWFRKE